MDTSETYTDPAQRLCDILTQLGQQNSNHKTREILANVFDVDSADTVQLLRIVIGILSLVQEVRSYIEENAGDESTSSLHLKAISAIEDVVSSYDLNAPWYEWHSAITSIQPRIDHLQFTSLHLFKSSQSPVVAEIEELKQSLNDLLAQIKESSIDDSVKKQLEIKLREMLEVLKLYRLYGDKGFVEIAEKVVGCAYFRYEAISKDKGMKEEILKFFRKLSPILGAVNTTVSTIGTAKFFLE